MNGWYKQYKTWQCKWHSLTIFHHWFLYYLRPGTMRSILARKSFQHKERSTRWQKHLASLDWRWLSYALLRAEPTRERVRKWASAPNMRSLKNETDARIFRLPHTPVISSSPHSHVHVQYYKDRSVKTRICRDWKVYREVHGHMCVRVWKGD